MRLLNAPALVYRVWRERGTRGVVGAVYRRVRGVSGGCSGTCCESDFHCIN
jgi:hypothetical protein